LYSTLAFGQYAFASWYILHFELVRHRFEQSFGDARSHKVPTFQQSKRIDAVKIKVMTHLISIRLQRFFYVCYVSLLSSGLIFAASNASSQAVPDYILGSGDSVKISVFLNPELVADTRISEQGLINFPLIGQVKIGGLSSTRAEELISDRLKQGNFVQKAQVLLSISTYRSQLVSVLGNVVKPGRYPLEVPGTRLSELLATVGGIAAGGSDIVILTRQLPNGDLKKLEIDLPSIYLEGKSNLDVVMQAGDSIYVHKQPNFYISGSVGRPGIYPIDRGLTVAQAVAKGGSYTLRSRESGIRLIRRNEQGKMIESTPKMDEAIQPDDQIFIRESLF
jgi:polysaccharide biosynthesis/export protein